MNEAAITKVRNALQRISETLAVAAPHVEDAHSADIAARLASAYAHLSAANAEIDALRDIAQTLRAARRVV